MKVKVRGVENYKISFRREIPKKNGNSKCLFKSQLPTFIISLLLMLTTFSNSTSFNSTGSGHCV